MCKSQRASLAAYNEATFKDLKESCHFSIQFISIVPAETRLNLEDDSGLAQTHPSTSPIAATTPVWVSWLEQMNTASGTFYVDIDLVNKSFPIPMRKVDQTQYAFIWNINIIHLQFCSRAMLTFNFCSKTD